jgi:putative transposase
MPQSFCNLTYHMVFATKDRRPWLGAEVRARVHQYLGGAIRREGGSALAVSGMPDHVHILAKLRQDKALSDVLRDVKANSSGWIHRTFPKLRTFAWQLGYAAFTVSPSQVDKARRYIMSQEEHHRGLCFKDELVALLTTHGVAFDLRYL